MYLCIPNSWHLWHTMASCSIHERAGVHCCTSVCAGWRQNCCYQKAIRGRQYITGEQQLGSRRKDGAVNRSELLEFSHLLTAKWSQLTWELTHTLCPPPNTNQPQPIHQPNTRSVTPTHSDTYTWIMYDMRHNNIILIPHIHPLHTLCIRGRVWVWGR